LLRAHVDLMERHFRGAGYNDASQDHGNRRRAGCGVACRIINVDGEGTDRVECGSGTDVVNIGPGDLVAKERSVRIHAFLRCPNPWALLDRMDREG
jgi:hypothetical protein